MKLSTVSGLLVLIVLTMPIAVSRAQEATTMVPVSVYNSILRDLEQTKRHLIHVTVSQNLMVLETKVDRILKNQTAIQKQLDVIRARAS